MKCNVASAQREREPETRMKPLAGAMTRGPCRLHPISSGVLQTDFRPGNDKTGVHYRTPPCLHRVHSTTLELTPCPECEGWCGKCEERCRWQKKKNQFGDLAVILERCHGCLNMGSCSGEGEK